MTVRQTGFKRVTSAPWCIFTGGGKAYEVEFVDGDGSTIALLTLDSSDIRPIEAASCFMLDAAHKDNNLESRAISNEEKRRILQRQSRIPQSWMPAHDRSGMGATNVESRFHCDQSGRVHFG